EDGIRGIKSPNDFSCFSIKIHTSPGGLFWRLRALVIAAITKRQPHLRTRLYPVHDQRASPSREIKLSPPNNTTTVPIQTKDFTLFSLGSDASADINLASYQNRAGIDVVPFMKLPDLFSGIRVQAI